MKFEAPDYSDEDIKAFFDTVINNREYVNSLVVYGAYIDNEHTLQSGNFRFVEQLQLCSCFFWLYVKCWGGV